LTTIAIYTLRFIFFIFKHTYGHFYFLYKESVYGDAIIFLNEAFSRVHWLQKQEPILDEKFVQSMSFICQNLKHIFEKKTRTTCSVSIKVAVETNVTANTEVKNLCRDNNSIIRDTDLYKKTTHFIFANTCFNIILSHLTKNQKNKLYYINNDINNTKDYENTSKESYENGVFPYQSELVVPIIPTHNEQDKVYNLLGFLCVDCKEINKFDEKYDLAIMQGVADGIYNIIQKRNKQQKVKRAKA